MFTKPINEITFEDVKTFCEEWPEGFRIEYKIEIKNIPKIVSSFANTLGGIFLIGVKADKTKNKVIFPIEGIPETPGIEEQVHQSALEGIYPAVIPEVRLLDVPTNSGNVIVIIRIDESVQAPHAIQNSTRVYIRTSSVTEPYKLADMDRIIYMLKRREDSQIVARQILNRIETRVKSVCSQSALSLTVIARPVFPYRPVISTSDIRELPDLQPWPPRRVTGGISCFNEEQFFELNEYGIVYHRVTLHVSDEQDIDYGKFLWHINDLIRHAKDIYEKCEYLGNIEVTAQLQEAFGKKLLDTENANYGRKITADLAADPECSDSEVRASERYLARDFESDEKRKDMVEELTCQLLWAFNIPTNQPQIRKRVRERIERHL